MLEYCRGAKEEGEALGNTMMKKLSGRQYFDNFYYKTKYYLPDSCFIIIFPKTAPLATDKAYQSTAVPSIATSAVQYAYRYTYKVLPDSNNIKATGIMMTGLFFPYLPIVYPIDWLRPNPLT